jgi:hypothetical protein
MDDETRASLTTLFGAALTSEGPWIAGVTGVARPRGEWEVAVSSRAPELPGDELTFVALSDGTLVVDEDIPDGTAAPLADAVEEYLQPPYRAAALRKDGELWAVAASRVTLLELTSVEGDRLEAARVGEGITFSVDGISSLPPLEVRGMLERYDGDVAVTAEHIDGTTWVAEVWRL